MEGCNTYQPWHDKATGRAFLKHDTGKCLHYYFYFINSEYGLCYLRVPTRAPFRLQFYFNGHSWLENKLIKHGITYTKLDNAFHTISDFAKAQELSDKIRVEDLHEVLDVLARRYCPLPETYGIHYNWSIMQVEYALDICFKKQEVFQPMYNFFSKEDQLVFEVIARGEFNIRGLKNKQLRELLPDKSSAAVSRIIKRLRTHGLIRKARNAYRYYLTKLGKAVIVAALKIRNMLLTRYLSGLSAVMG